MTQKTNVLADAGILTREQLLSDLGVTVETLTRWEQEEGFPGKKVGRSALYDVEAIRKWINKKPR